MIEEDYKKINEQLWNDKVAHHLASEFYNMPGFMKGETSLRAPELGRLEGVTDKHVLHLQCHFGQDTLSLARMGAKVVGVDLSGEAIAAAQKINAELELDATFVQSDVYELPSRLHKQFDMVFTSYGVLGWLPDMDKWAGVVSHFLKPGGKLLLVEFHPAVWMMDDDFQSISYSYFNRAPIIELTEGSYAEKEAPIANKSISWNHSLGEVMGALANHGMRISHFEELDYSPYDCFQHTEKIAPQQYQIAHLKGMIPMVYMLEAEKMA